jgi:hypothetical protein
VCRVYHKQTNHVDLRRHQELELCAEVEYTDNRLYCTNAITKKLFVNLPAQVEVHFELSGQQLA